MHATQSTTQSTHVDTCYYMSIHVIPTVHTCLHPPIYMYTLTTYTHVCTLPYTCAPSLHVHPHYMCTPAHTTRAITIPSPIPTQKRLLGCQIHCQQPLPPWLLLQQLPHLPIPYCTLQLLLELLCGGVAACCDGGSDQLLVRAWCCDATCVDCVVFVVLLCVTASRGVL